MIVIDLIMAIPQPQRILYELPAGTGDERKKGEIYRWLHDNRFSGLRKGHDCGMQRRNHAGAHHDPVSLDLPAMTTPQPINQRLIQTVGKDSVPIYRMGGASGKRLGDRGWSGEIHVRDP